MPGPDILLRRLGGWQAAGLTCLSALAWPEAGGRALRFHFQRGTAPAALEPAPGAIAGFGKAERAGTGVIATGRAPAGTGTVLLEMAAGRVEAPVEAPEPELFDDLDVILGQRHAETPAQVADWLRYHAETHGATGALILDRAAPGGAFAAQLRPLVERIEGLVRLVVIGCDIPLGARGHAALGDPATAPRAGERRFRPDRWTAELADGVVFDALKWRFLARAGAVVALDPCDILRAPDDGIPVFAAVRQSHTGLIPLRGQMIYPWRIRKNAAPHLGDHVCRAEPPVAAPLRWAAAPGRLPGDAIWLATGPRGVPALEDDAAAYDRAACLIHQHSDVGDLVDKDLLELDPALMRRAVEVLGHKPVDPPARARPSPAAAPEPPPSGRVAVVTCMKNEGPFILEWVAWHRMIGVDDFLVYTNDCDDGTVELLDALAAKGLVVRRDNPRPSPEHKPQAAALKAAIGEEVIRNAGWILSMDVDEFINIHAGDGHLRDLFRACNGASLISMTWRLFGNADIAGFDPAPVTAQFTACAPQLIRRPHQAWGFKTLFRNEGLWQGIGVHRPRGYLGQGSRWVNGSGKPMPDSYFKTGWRNGVDNWGYGLVTLNHYACRSAESFLVKRDRGRVNHVTRDQGDGYWFRMNNNAETDTSIQRHLPRLRAAIDTLLADPELARLHAACIAAHRSRIAALRSDPEYAALYDRITGARLRRLSRMHRHFGMNVFLSGPDVIPDAALDPGLADNFFFNCDPPRGRAAE